MHPASLPPEKLLLGCDIKKTRRGGPGGQHRNKVESAIVITHRPTSIIGQAGERRSQHENRAVAIERLRVNLALGVRDPVSPEQSPSELWRGRVKGQKISVSDQHADFPAVLAEALDFLAACEFDVVATAERLAISSSQLVKLLKSVPPAFQYLNDQRQVRDLSVLR
jgi:hypothetical protein